MLRILRIMHMEDKGEYAIIYVTLSDGEEAEVWVGGQVETYFHKGKIKAYVKRIKDAN